MHRKDILWFCNNISYLLQYVMVYWAGTSQRTEGLVLGSSVHFIEEVGEKMDGLYFPVPTLLSSPYFNPPVTHQVFQQQAAPVTMEEDVILQVFCLS